jgi:hypothetical protein
MTKYKEAFRAWRETQYGPGPTPGDKECPYCKKVGGHECNCFGPPPRRFDKTEEWDFSHPPRPNEVATLKDRIKELETEVETLNSFLRGIEGFVRLALAVDEVSLSPGVGVPTGNDHGC